MMALKQKRAGAMWGGEQAYSNLTSKLLKLTLLKLNVNFYLNKE